MSWAFAEKGERLAELPWGGSVPPEFLVAPDPDAATEKWVEWANRLPNLAAFGVRCTKMDDEFCYFDLVDTAHPLNPNGALNGGVIAGAMDQAMGVVGSRVTPPGYSLVTAGLSVQFHSPAMPSVRMVGRVLPGGNRVKFVETVMYDCAGRRCATEQGTMVIGPVPRICAGRLGDDV